MSALRHYTQMQKRLLLLESVLFLCILCVEGRLVYLQVFKYPEFRRLAYHQQCTPPWKPNPPVE